MSCEGGRGGKRWSRRDVLAMIGAASSGILLLECGAPSRPATGSGSARRGLGPSKPPRAYRASKHRWAFAVDVKKCVGCTACMRACRDENDVPAGYFRTWIERYHIAADGSLSVDIATSDDHVFAKLDGRGGAGTTKAFFVPKLCNHCEDTPCTQVCPVGASFTTRDGVVQVDPQLCIGCGYCVQACPYGSRFINPETHLADKCTLCYHRVARGAQPACVEVCPTGARIFGDLNDPRSAVSRVAREHDYRVLRPELGTRPRCRYLGLDVEIV